MQNQTADIRKTWGCGFEPAATGNLAPFVRVPVPIGCDVKPTTCPGYTTRLPEVIETARARLHWSKGSLDQFVRGWATEHLIGAIEILEGSSNEVQAWSMANPQKKAGS